MKNDLYFLMGFISINLGFLFLYPNYIIINAAVNKGINSSKLSTKLAYRDKRRYIISFVSLIAFSISVFLARLPGLGLIAGFIISSIFVALDYRNIYHEADRLR